MKTAVSDSVADPSPLIEWGVAMQVAVGQAESGDQYLVESYPEGVLVAVVDGLGHGTKAAAVAKAAVAALEGHGQEPVDVLLRRCHRGLLGTRGVVINLASFSALEGTMTWLGVGNVSGFLLYADPKTDQVGELLLSRGGVVGYQIPSPHPVAIHLTQGDTLVFATDGICSSFVQDLALDDAPQQIADRVLARHLKGTDDAVVLVARYLGRGDI